MTEPSLPPAKPLVFTGVPDEIVGAEEEKSPRKSAVQGKRFRLPYDSWASDVDRRRAERGYYALWLVLFCALFGGSAVALTILVSPILLIIVGVLGLLAPAVGLRVYQGWIGTMHSKEEDVLIKDTAIWVRDHGQLYVVLGFLFYPIGVVIGIAINMVVGPIALAVWIGLMALCWGFVAILPEIIKRLPQRRQ